MKLRKVSLPSVPPHNKPVSYDLDVSNDAFWNRFAREAFPIAIEGHDQEVKQVEEKESKIRRTAGSTDDAEAELEMAEALVRRRG
jgi:hypothetical protein